MSVEDRLRTATRARADLVSHIRPLELPAREQVRRPRASGTRRWVSWAAPVTAAAVVVALAVTLVSLRQMRSAPAVPAAAQPGTSATTAADTVPEFYATLNSSITGSGPTTLVVGRTGARTAIATVRSPKGQSFVGVTGAADDRTFVVAAEAYPAQKGIYSGAPVAWYLVRVPATAGYAAKLTKLTIPAQPKGTQVSGIALAPNAGELAVLFQRNVWSGTRGPLTLSLYSVSTGKALRTWTQQANGARVGFGWYSGLYSNTSITWLNGQKLAFDEGVYSPPPSPQLDPAFSDVKIRTLSLSSPGSGLLADSKVVFTARNSSCDTLQLTVDERSVFCGTSGGSANAKSSAYDPRIFEYSVATGKSRLVYRRAGVYNYGVADVLWLNADGSSLVGGVFDQTKMAGGSLQGYDDVGLIVKGVLKPIIIPVFGAPSAGQIAF
jgi:hypothetical protein